jgi:hypothetical protein
MTLLYSLFLSIAWVAWTVYMSRLGWLLASRFVRPDPQNHRAVTLVEVVYTICCLMGMSATWIGNDILLNRMELLVLRMVGFIIALSASGAIWYYSLEQRHSDHASLEIVVEESEKPALHAVCRV